MRTVHKQTVTLHDLLAAHGAPSTIHYVCLDIEGAERRRPRAGDEPFTDEIYEHYFFHPELAEARPHLVME